MGGSAPTLWISRPARCSRALRPARSADPQKGPFLGVLQAIRRLLTRPKCFRLEREFAGLGFHQGEQCTFARHTTKLPRAQPCSLKHSASFPATGDADPPLRTGEPPGAASPRRQKLRHGFGEGPAWTDWVAAIETTNEKVDVDGVPQARKVNGMPMVPTMNRLARPLTGWAVCAGLLDLGSHMKTSRTNRFNLHDTAVRDHKKLLHAPLRRISRKRRLQRYQPFHAKCGRT